VDRHAPRLVEMIGGDGVLTPLGRDLRGDQVVHPVRLGDAAFPAHVRAEPLDPLTRDAQNRR
jgi:hypothetical protein